MYVQGLIVQPVDTGMRRKRKQYKMEGVRKEGAVWLPYTSTSDEENHQAP